LQSNLKEQELCVNAAWYIDVLFKDVYSAKYYFLRYMSDVCAERYRLEFPDAEIREILTGSFLFLFDFSFSERERTDRIIAAMGYSTGAEQGHIFRVRHDELYPDRATDNGNVVIYPQSSKYVASRLDPFGCMFQHFRTLLGTGRRQVLFICGYSFGDDHIIASTDSCLIP
jgi:hypothetical protein